MRFAHRLRPRSPMWSEPLEKRVLLSAVGFQSTVYPGDESVQSLTAGDFNGDGKADLIAVDGAAHDVRWYRGNGDGTFAAPLTTTLGDVEPYSAVGGDFNGDGKLDLLVLSASSNAALLLRGNGDGTFQPPVRFAVGPGPATAVVGDFNRDGRLDFATANSGSNTVSIMLQQPGGSFVAAPDVTVGQSPTAIAAADFDGDGTPDLAVGGADGVYLLYGNGNGTFGSSFVSIPSGGKVTALSAADLNGDGKPDLAATLLGAVTSPVTVLLNQGGGAFAATALPPANSVSVPSSIATANFVNDGLPDLLAIASHAGGFQSSVYINTGAGVFGLAGIENDVPGPAPAAVADFNGDGLSDVVIANTVNDLVVYLSKPIVNVQGASLIGSHLAGARVATFRDNARPNDPGGSFAATVFWGDGPSSPGTVVSDGNGNFHVSADHAFKYDRTYNYSVSITDAAGHAATATGTVSVADAPPTVTIAEFPAPTSGSPDEIAPGPGTDLWFLENARQNSGTSSAVLIDSTGRTLKQITLPLQNSPRPAASDAAGKLWFKQADGILGDVFPTDPFAGSFAVPALSGAGVAMARGGDGNVWFLGSSGLGVNRLGRITFNGAINVTLVSLSKSIPGASRMIVGPDGDFWAAETTPQTLARIKPDGTVSEVSIPTAAGNDPSPVADLTADFHGNVWFALRGASVIGRIAPDGTITQFPQVFATRLAADSGGNVWFTNPGIIGRLTPEGSLEAYKVPSSDFPLPGSPITGPFGLTAGADGNLWFTEQFAQKVGRIDPAAAITLSVPPLTSARAAVPFSGQVATFTDPRSGRPAADYAASINWGDFTISPGTITLQPDGSFAVSGSHTYASERVDRSLAVTVTPIDDVPVFTSNAVALDYPLDLVQTRAALEVEGSSDLVPLLDFRDEDAASSQFAATIDWGDRASGTGVVSRTSAGTYLVSGSHAYRNDGVYPVHVHVADFGGSQLDADLTIRVSDAPQFGPAAGYYAYEPGPLAVGDMNVDGRPDLVAAGPGTIYVLPGGDGFFALPLYPPTHLPNSDPINQIALGDVNHDGKLDVLYAQSGTLGILLGNGDGTLGAPSTTSILGNRFATADFNRDGKLDVVSNGDGNTLTVLLGSGNGTFRASTLSLLRPGSSYSVVTGDFNGDGKADIALAGADPAGIGAAVTVWLGNGDGTFHSPTSYPLYPGSSTAVTFLYLAAADVNGDGKTDLVAADGASHTLSVLLNARDGTFLAAANSPLDLSAPFSTSPGDQVLNDFQISDVNGDGIPDLLMSDGIAGGSVRLRLGRGDGTFLSETVLPMGPGWVVAADLNGDGLVDLALAQRNYSQILVNLANPITVLPVPIAGTEGQSQTFTVATFRNEDGPGTADEYSASIDWGDNHTTTGLIVPQRDGSWAVVGTHTYSQAFPYMISVNVIAPHRLHSSVQSIASIADAPITVSGKTITGVAGAEMTGLVADFTDANPCETSGNYTASVFWEDSNTPQPATIVPDGHGGWAVYATHTFSASGAFPFTVQVQDAASHPTYNGFGSANITWVSHGGGSISGIVFADFNRDTVREIGEPTLLGWMVYVDTNNNGRPDPGDLSAVSSATGHYVLADVPGGTWTVREVVPSGWRADVPAALGQTVTLADGQILDGHDLANVHAPPVVTAATVDYASPFADLVFTFDEDVRFPPSLFSITVRNVDTGESFVWNGMTYDPATRTLRFLQSIHPDGRYEVVLPAAPITDAFGQHLDGSGTGAGGDFTFDFSLLTGDLNHDGRVDFADLLVLAQHFNQTGTYQQGDLNDDGQVDFRDLLILAQHYGHSLTMPTIRTRAKPQKPHL